MESRGNSEVPAWPYSLGEGGRTDNMRKLVLKGELLPSPRQREK